MRSKVSLVETFWSTEEASQDHHRFEQGKEALMNTSEGVAAPSAPTLPAASWQMHITYMCADGHTS